MKLFDRQKKWEINLYSYYDHAGIVRHLEDMARQGWELEKAGSVFWTYRRGQTGGKRPAPGGFFTARPVYPGPPAGRRGVLGECETPPGGGGGQRASR